MIYLFNNCFLSRIHQSAPDSKQVWIGSIVDQLQRDVNYSHAHDIHKIYRTITTEELNSLFTQLYTKYTKRKVVIYCDDEYFQFVYFSFFSGLMPFESVKIAYELDAIKENLLIGYRNYGRFVSDGSMDNIVPLSACTMETIEPIAMSSTIEYPRIELAFANMLLGSSKAKTYVLDRVEEMWEGFIQGPMLAGYVEQNLPALMTDEEFNPVALNDSGFITNYLKPLMVKEVIPVKTIEHVDRIFNIDHLNYYFNTQNDNQLTVEEYTALWENASLQTKRQFIEERVVNPTSDVKLGLQFPDAAHLDSVNPLLWNRIFRHYDDVAWLEQFRVNTLQDGTNNQTDGTV